MVLYLFGIVGGGTLICILNLIFCNGKFDYTTPFIIIASVLAVILEIAIDGAIAALIRKVLPEKYFNHTVSFHNPSKKECKLYERLGVKVWKDHVLELGQFTDFSKREVANPNSIEYIERFILENNYGAILHILSCFLGFILIPFFPGHSKVTIILPAAIINFVLNLLPFMILRYNTDRLQRIRKVLAAKAARNTEKSE